MDDKVRRLLKVLEALTEAQKQEFLTALRGFEVRGKLNEDVRKEIGLIMGPLGGRCPYCGK